MSDKPAPRCRACGETFEDLAGIEHARLPNCTGCGATDKWGYRIDLGGSNGGSASSGGGTLSHTTDAAISPELVGARITVFDPTVTVEDLPTEVIAEALRAGINLVPLGPGQWGVEVGLYGVVGQFIPGRLTTGELADGLLDAIEYIEGLASYWRQTTENGG